MHSIYVQHHKCNVDFIRFISELRISILISLSVCAVLPLFISKIAENILVDANIAWKMQLHSIVHITQCDRKIIICQYYDFIQLHLWAWVWACECFVLLFGFWYPLKFVTLPLKESRIVWNVCDMQRNH